MSRCNSKPPHHDPFGCSRCLNQMTIDQKKYIARNRKKEKQMVNAENIDNDKFEKEMLKAGTWIAFDCDMFMLKEHEKKGSHTTVSNGVIETYINIRERAYPLTLRNRNIVREFEGQIDSLREKVGRINLNWPDIHREHCQMFDDAILTKTTEEWRKVYDKLLSFNNEILEKIEGVGTVNGISIFR